jgi:hypothetical protein
MERHVMDKYIEILKNPSDSTRGLTRWWWYGCAVDEEEIKRELTVMKEAHIGGVEIQILYAVSPDLEKKGIKNIPFYSKEFFEVLKFTTEYAKQLGMTVDFTFGSSWPYGGPFVPGDMAPESAVPYQIDVSGPCSFSYDFTTVIGGQIIKLVMGRMEKGIMAEDSVQDITSCLKDKELYGWPWGKYIDNIKIPDGDYKIVAYVIEEYKQLLGAPTREAQGYAIDHCRRDVSDFYFKNAGKPVIDKLGRGAINSFFCDSIELSGNNWTTILLDEFKKRRGYSLDKYMYGLWGKVGNISDRLRYDYYKTMSELTIENFFENMTKWCNENGSKSRTQAHGIWADILKTYGTADIPEGETFGPQDKLMVNTVHRKCASSAAHIYGKELASNESFTWLRVPRFLETLENMKAEADAIFLDGMNMIVNHGYAYSPKDSGKLGWPFYASSHICDKNTYWPYYKEMGAYIQRVSGILRLGRHKCDTAIYLPQADVWSENPLSNLHMSMKLEEYMGWGTTDRISKSGYYFDYINDEALTSLGKMENGFNINGNTYSMIVLIGCKRLPVETAKALKDFVQAGGRLVASDAMPFESCGLIDYEANDEAVKQLMGEVFPKEKDSWVSFGKGCAAVASDRGDKLIELMEKQQRPDVKIKNNSDTVGYVHRVDGDNDIFFMSNISSEYKNTSIEFSVCGKGFRFYDALSCKEVELSSIKYCKDSTEVSFNFEPFQSVVAVFESSLPLAGAATAWRQRVVKEMDISSSWRLSVPEENFTAKLDTISCWESFPELSYYSGEGWYESSFKVPETEVYHKAVLNLTSVNEIAEIYINNRRCGTLWKKPYKIDITEYLSKGDNTIRIKAVNRLINNAIKPDNEAPLYEGEVMDQWPYFTESINQLIKRRIHNWREKAAVKEPVPSGISGRAYIEFTALED